MKKLLALVLALVMTMSLVTISNAAFSDADKIDHKEAVEVMSALGVINGMPDGSFNPSGNVTRAEMAKMISIIMLGDIDAAAFVGTTTDLKDINGHWAEGYIKYCYSQGVIAGRGDGTFAPNANVTAVEAAKMLCVAIGYNATVQGYVGGDWAINIIRDAQLSKLFDDLSVASTKVLTRDEAAQMIYNAINAKMIEKKPSISITNGNITYSYEQSDSKTLLSETFGAKTFIGTLTGNDKTVNTCNKGEVQVNGKLDTENSGDRFAQFPSTISLSNIGEEVKVIYKEGKGGFDNRPDKKDTIYGVYNTGNTTVYNITLGDLQEAKASNLSNGKIKFGDATYEVAAFAASATDDVVLVNNYDNTDTVTVDALDGNTSDNDGATKTEFATWIDTNLRQNSGDMLKLVCNSDGKIAKIYTETWAYTKVLSLTKDKIQLEGIGSKDLDDVKFLDDVKVDDIVAIAEFYSGDNEETQIKKAELLQGKVDAKDGDKLRVNGTWYKKAANVEKLGDYSDSMSYSVGDEYKFVLDGGKYYVAGKTVSADVKYAMVLKAANGINDQVKLLLEDGTKQTFVINSDSSVKYNSTVNGTAVSSIGSTNEANAIMVKYELVKNGTEVKMTAVDAVKDLANGETHSFNKDTKVLTTYKTVNSDSGDTEALNAKQVVSDSAVAFVYDTTNTKWKVLDANNIKTFDAADQTTAYVATDDGKVVAFSLISNNAPAAAGSSTAYGYVTGKIETKNGDDKVTELSVWNGEETVTVKVDGTATAAKGDFIKYIVSDKAIANIDATVLSGAGFDTVKVKEYDASRSIVITTTDTYSVSGELVGGNEDVYKVDKDTKVIGVNVEDKKGSTNNAITAFTKVSGQDYNNAKIAYELDGTTKVIKAIFVDEKNNISNSGNATIYTVANATVQAVGLTVTATADKAAAISGETVTYTVKVSGTAAAGAANDTITLALSGLTGATTLVDSTPATATNCSIRGLIITIAADSLATSGTFTVSGTVSGTGNVTATLTHAAA